MPSSSTTVDLSRLPAPDVIELLDFDTIYAAMAADMAKLFPGFSALVDSDPAVKVMQLCAYREQLLRQVANDSSRQNMVAFATGANLDHLAALIGVTRLVITPATDTADAVLEDDGALRQRIVLAPESFSVAGPELAYVYHAKSASGDVLDASATSPAPGQVLVSVLSNISDGAASAELIGAVRAVLGADTVRPLTDQLTVASATIVPFAVTARLWLFAGPDATVIQTAAAASLQAYLARSRLLGRNIPLSALYAALQVEGVERVELVSPAADVVMDATQAAWCTAASVTIAGNDD
jgi:phage-related baseplate assembly protein